MTMAGMKLVRERNAIVKNPRGKLRVALVYPQRYRAGVANLGMQIVYAMLNQREEVYAERFYLDVHDGVRSIETRSPLRDFEVIAVCWQFEPDALNLLSMLERGGVPLDRGERRQVVLAGGPCAVNPLPLADFVDAFYIGEAEAGVEEVVEALHAGERSQVLEELASLDYFYVPGVKEHATRVLAEKLAPLPVHQVVSEAGAFGESYLLEVARGCTRSCRFCLGGYIFRPRRERDVGEVEALVREWADSEVRKVALLGASVTDYTHLERLTGVLSDVRMQVSAPSLRADALTPEFLEMLVRSGQRTVTIAPESCEELRLRLNKRLTDDVLMEAVRLCSEAGVRNLKLYMMYGLPGERREHVEAAAALVREVAKAFRGRVRVSLSPFIPKPHTPLQRCGFAGVGELRRRFRLFRKLLGGIEVEGESPRASWVQAVIARGGRELGEVLLGVHRRGSGEWRRAPAPERELSGELPWECIDVRIARSFFEEEYRRYLAGEASPECFPGCRRCGACT